MANPIATSDTAPEGELQFTSQFQQDVFLDQQVFMGRQNGNFVEIGAADPVHGSNSYFLETYRNWLGVCIEARSLACEIFKEKRKSPVINAAVGQTPGKTLFLELGAYSGIAKYMTIHEFENLVRFAETAESIRPRILEEVLLENIIKEYGMKPLDLLMIDTEGAEETILRASTKMLPHTKVVLVECNTNDALKSLSKFLNEHNFEFIKSLAIDNIFVNRAFSHEFKDLFDKYVRNK
jgi:FkbM family methyltransferase